MPKNVTKAPRVFISYSWSTPAHESRILEWAERLVSNDGVDVVLDKWHLKEGQDKYAFMEKMVTDSEVQKVVVFSDKGYAEKADHRKGGVGTESQIISREVYEKVTQEKFLPVVCERDDTGEPYLPAFLKSRIYFDFSNPETFHENYEKLVRAIFNKPLHKRPTLGKPPEYILSDDKLAVWSRPFVQSFKDAVLQDRKSYLGHATAFLDAFVERLEEFRVTPEDGKEFDDQVLASIDSFLPFRDNFIEFLNIVVVYRSESELYDRIAGCFERFVAYKYPPPGMSAWSSRSFDTYNFIVYELFLYLVALLIKHRKFDDLLIFTERLYYLPEGAGAQAGSLAPFTILRGYCESLAYRNKRLNLGRLSLLADLLKQRSGSKPVLWAEIMQAEGLLFLKSLLDSKCQKPWYPHTLIYAGYAKTFEIFARAAQRKEFQRLRRVLGVETKDELVAKFKAAVEDHGVAQWREFRMESVDFAHLFGIEKLETL